eukprot:3548873-Amphidinium_carterae.1
MSGLSAPLCQLLKGIGGEKPHTLNDNVASGTTHDDVVARAVIPCRRASPTGAPRSLTIVSGGHNHIRDYVAAILEDHS